MVVKFSEWTVRMAFSHDLRPQTDSDNHLSPTSTFYTEFGDYLEAIALCEEQLVVVGDFNIHVDLSNDSNSMKLLNFLESFSLQQHVVDPTQVCGHTLVLIITRQSDQIIRSTPKVDSYISDHASVLCQLHSSKPPLLSGLFLTGSVSQLMLYP